MILAIVLTVNAFTLEVEDRKVHNLTEKGLSMEWCIEKTKSFDKIEFSQDTQSGARGYSTGTIEVMTCVEI